MGLRRPPGTTAARPGNSQSDFTGVGGSAGRSRYIIAPDPGPDTVDDLLPASVQSTSEVTKPVIGQTHNILANDVQSASEVTKPVIGQKHALLANDTESASEVTKPAATLVRALLANDVESASSLTKPSLFAANQVSVTNTASPAGVAGTGNVVTYTNLALGVSRSDRVIALAVTAELAGCTINSAEIDYGSGYVTMNAGTQGNQGDVYARMFWFHVPTGGPADFRITFGANPSSTQNKVQVFRVIDAATSAIAASGADASTDMSGDPLTTGSITVPSLGLFLAVAAGATDTDSKSWTNATFFVNDDAGDFRYTSARSTTSGSVTVSVSGGSSGEDGALSWMTFYPVATVNELLASDVESASSLTKPAITQTHYILANDAESPSELSKPVLTPVAGVFNLLAEDVQSASELAKPTLAIVVPPEPIFTGKVKGRKKDKQVEGRKQDATGKARIGSSGIIGRTEPGTIRGRK